MKYYIGCVALLLCSCVSMTEQDFLKDPQNQDKFTEVQEKVEVSLGCERLGKLYDFKQKENPTIDDLSEIMPVFGLQKSDAANIDKVYAINLSVIESYTCEDSDNADQLITEFIPYCNNQYHDDATKRQDCKYILNSAIQNSDKYKHKKQMLNIISEYGIKNLQYWAEVGVERNINKIYSVPENYKTFVTEFKASELIKANQDVLGTYDGECYADVGFCDTKTKNVTRLSAIMTLYDFCLREYWDRTEECKCFAHETYKKVDYKNVIYTYEKRDLPQSKKAEFNRIYNKCEQKEKQRRINADKARYGESSETVNNNQTNGFISDAVDNAAWVHKTITETRKAAEKQ